MAKKAKAQPTADSALATIKEIERHALANILKAAKSGQEPTAASYEFVRSVRERLSVKPKEKTLLPKAEDFNVKDAARAMLPQLFEDLKAATRSPSSTERTQARQAIVQLADVATIPEDAEEIEIEDVKPEEKQ